MEIKLTEFHVTCGVTEAAVQQALKESAVSLGGRTMYIPNRFGPAVASAVLHNSPGWENAEFSCLLGGIAAYSR